MNRLLTALVVLMFPATLNAQDKLYPNEFPLADVRLLDGPFKHAQELNVEVLLQYDVDRLLAPYLIEAGLTPKKPPFPNWAGLDGHVAGHYLSAMAMNYASSGNEECRRRMEYMISELKLCQDANGRTNPEWGMGYVGGFPNSAELWDSFRKGDFIIYNASWAPFYNLHKMFAGLRDAWLYADNEQARRMFLDFCDWGIRLTSELSDEQMQSMLDMEHGGINESYADAYQMTGDEKYLVAARRFSHRAFLDPLAEGIDNLDNRHANTQIPKFVGFERIAELDDDSKFDQASINFWQTVTENRSLAFGGNSRREHFPAKVASIDYITEDDGPETCNSYNMLKLTEDLFRNHPRAGYVDYYERTLFNHILSSQHPEHGGYVYFTSARPRHYRVYSVPNMAMWCCVGTGMENHSKYQQFIYTHTGDSLYLNLFIASTLQWKEKGVSIRQETSFPYDEGTSLTITDGSADFNLMIRYPGWVAPGDMRISVNGQDVELGSAPGSFVSVKRSWMKGDRVDISMTMRTSLEPLPNVPEYVAIMHGPILLGASAGTSDLAGLKAGEGRWAQHTSGEKLPIDEAPIIVVDNRDQIIDKIVPVGNEPLHYTLEMPIENPVDNTLRPFFEIHDSRYMMYWLALTKDGYKEYTDSLAAIEKTRLELEARTTDYVSPGEQQPETDHAMKQENSFTGNNMNEFWRDARNGGYFSYELDTRSETGLSLLVRYWGAEWGNRKYDLYIDNEKLQTIDNTGKWNVAMFREEIYEIPDAMISGKTKIRVKFQSVEGSTAGAVYEVRLLGKM